MNLVSMPISQLATVQSGGGAPQDSAAFTRTGSPFVRAGSLPKLLDGAAESSLELLEPDVADRHGLRLFPAGTVLFAKSGMSATKGYVYRLIRPAYVVSHLAALVPHEPSDSAFLVYALQRYSPTVLIKDPAYPSIRLGDIESMKIQAPTSPRDRKRISQILDSADALRAKRRAAVALLDSLRKSIFLDMFGDPATNAKGWPTSRLDKVCKLVNGRAFKPEEWEESGLPIIRIQNLNDTTKPFNYTMQTFPERFRVRVGDILFSWSGTPGTSFGCFRWEGPEGWLNQHIFNVRLEDTLDGDFFITHINLKLGELIAKAHGGVGLQHVTKGMVDETILFIPPETLQREYARRVSSVERLAARLNLSRDKFDHLFASLQHRAFQGQL